MITETRTPYEFLARWDHETGTFKGAHIQFYDAILKDGVMITGAPSKAFGIGDGMAFPLADIVGQVTIDALAANETLQAQLADQTEALAQLDAITAERNALLAQIAELTAPPTGRVLQADDYRGRFTGDEQDSILAAAYSGDTICQKLLMQVWTNRKGIDLDSTDVINGLAYLTSIGILKDGRAAEIRA